MLPPKNITPDTPGRKPARANTIREDTFCRQIRSYNDNEDFLPPDEKLVREAEKRLRDLDEADEKDRRLA